MAKSFLELIVGDLDEKRAYRKFMKRVDALPKEYRYSFKKIQHYFYNFSVDMSMLSDLLEMFEESAAEGKSVIDVIGSDVADFCDELLRVSTKHTKTSREKLNEEIQRYFHKEDK